MEAMETNIIPLGDMAGEDPVAELILQEFLPAEREPYMGKVKASVTFLDPGIFHSYCCPE